MVEHQAYSGVNVLIFFVDYDFLTMLRETAVFEMLLYQIKSMIPKIHTIIPMSHQLCHFFVFTPIAEFSYFNQQLAVNIKYIVIAPMHNNCLQSIYHDANFFKFNHISIFQLTVFLSQLNPLQTGQKNLLENWMSVISTKTYDNMYV